MIVTATFIGANNSSGYKKNKKYNLELHIVPKLIFDNEQILIVKSDGTGRCSYLGLKAFLQNWKSLTLLAN